MNTKKYLILGAGPAGLTLANKLKEAGETSFLVLEKEAEAGGLCRSADVDGAPLDIGGGHFLDVCRPKVTEFLFQFMPEKEWNVFDRDSKVSINGKIIDCPLESNLWQMDIDEQIEYLLSIASAGCNTGEKPPQNYTEWIPWKLGRKIAENYMIPYNTKMFGDEIDNLGAYWMEKLPDVSFEETLRSCLTHVPYGKLPCVHRFYAPKEYGYGEVWLRMADAIKDSVEYGKAVTGIDFNTLTVTTTDGSRYTAENIITTIPWMEFSEIIGMPEEIKTSISELKYGSVEIEYFPDNVDTSAHWIYYSEPELAYNRILFRHNFYYGSKGYWTETQGHRLQQSDRNNFRYLNKYAYPFMTKKKPEIMKHLLEWAEKHNVYGLGRWGEHQYYNSDVTVGVAMDMAKRLMGRTNK